MAIVIDFLANVSSLLKGTTDAEAAFDDVADSLDDLASESQRAGDALGDNIEDGAKDADRATERLERSFRDLANAAKRESKDAGDDIGRNVKRGTKKAEEGLDDLKSESASTAKESAASFDGSAESIVGSFQEIAANAFAGFGPAGLAAGAAAAIGIGLVQSAFETANTMTEESKERAAEWAQAYIDAGSRILDSSTVFANAQAIVTDPKRYQEAKDNAREWGVSESLALLAMAGNTDALTEAASNLAIKKKEVADTPVVDQTSEDFLTLFNDVRNGEEALGQLRGEMQAGADQAGVYSEALRLTAENTAGATTKTDEFGDSVVTLPDGKQIYIDAQTGQATENVDAIEKKVYGIPASKTVQILADTAALDAKIEEIRQARYQLTFDVNLQQRGRFVP